MKPIAIFGTYNPEYPRNRVLRKALDALSVHYVELCDRKRGLGKYLRLVGRGARTPHSALYVGVPGHTAMLSARLATRSPIFFDSFVSLFDTYVADRGLVKPDSSHARVLRALDRTACRLATRVIVDTRQHLDFFSRELGIPREKLMVIPVATDVDLFRPEPARQNDSDSFIVYWHGRYSPLHNVGLILDAAEMQLHDESYVFHLLGSKGQEYAFVRKSVQERRLKNVTFLDAVPYEQLPSFVNAADVCLGVFGTSDKVDRVVPNKLHEYMACGKAVITRESAACRELLTGADISYVPALSAAALVEKIVDFRHDKGRHYVSEANRRISESLFSQVCESYRELFVNL